MAVVIAPPRRDQFFDKDGQPTLRFIKWIENLTITTNESVTNITDNSVRESFAWDTFSDDSLVDSAGIEALYSQDQMPAPKEWRAVTVTGGTYTALDHDFINAKANAVIYFPECPGVNVTFTARNGDGSAIKLDGNGKNINGSKTGTLIKESTAIDFHYFIDSDEWFAR